MLPVRDVRKDKVNRMRLQVFQQIGFVQNVCLEGLRCKQMFPRKSRFKNIRSFEGIFVRVFAVLFQHGPDLSDAIFQSRHVQQAEILFSQTDSLSVHIRSDYRLDRLSV